MYASWVPTGRKGETPAVLAHDDFRRIVYVYDLGRFLDMPMAVGIQLIVVWPLYGVPYNGGRWWSPRHKSTYSDYQNQLIRMNPLLWFKCSKTIWIRAPILDQSDLSNLDQIPVCTYRVSCVNL
jgi:hypothetical protein